MAQSTLSGAYNPLITTGDANQMAAWLGEGDLSFTSVFDHVSGDGKTSHDFHSAVDSLTPGATFSVLIGHVNSSGAAFMIGGYDPLAWNSSGTYNIDPTNAGRTAFIFNLTNDTMQTQDLLSVLNSGQYQTLNDASLGPTFGGGADIQVGTNLNSGSLYAYSYGSGFNLLGDVTGTNTLVTYDSVDVFRFTPAPTPEPLTLLIGASGVTLFLRRRVRARA